jgi:hypothetical protein
MASEAQQAAEDAKPEGSARLSRRARRRRAAGRVSYALSLLMLASPTMLALMYGLSWDRGQPNVASHPPPSSAERREPAVAAWTSTGGLQTRTTPVIDVKVNREVPRGEVAGDKSRARQAVRPTPAPASEPPPVAPGPGALSPLAALPSALAPPASAPAVDPPSSIVPPPHPQAWSETEIAAALKSCLARLAPLAMEVEVRAPVKDNACGLPAPIAVARLGPDRVEIQPPAVLNCALASAVHEWLQKVAQPAAQEALGSPIVKLTGISGYACRNRNGAANGPISEHAFGNAFDVSGFVLSDGRVIAVAHHWGPTARDTSRPALNQTTGSAAGAPSGKVEGRQVTAGLERGRSRLGGPQSSTSPSDPRPAAPERTKEAMFLRRIHTGACSLFGTVLGPEANEAHRDHLHFDMKDRRRSGVCE